MIKLVAISMLSLVTNFQIMTNTKSETNNESCFSKSNFDSVCRFISMKMQNDKTKEYIHGDWEIVLDEFSEIRFRKKGYTYYMVNEERGIFSIMKYNVDKKDIQKINHIFCELVVLAKN